MTTFAVTDPQHTLSALNYVISNLGSASGVYGNTVLTVDNVTNQVTVGVGGEIYSYNVQWMNIRYATNATGTQGFSTSPINAGYYGLQATADQYPSTLNDPGYYVWYQVSGGFGTTNVLFYQTPGGRQITFDVGNTAPNSNFLVVGDGTPVDLDIVTTTFIANSVITGNNIVPGTITGNLIAANTITSVNIANGTITGTDIALYTIQANNIANGVIAVSNVSNGTSNITIENNGNINFAVGGVSNVAAIKSTGISTSGNVSGNLLFGFTISTTGTVSANNAVITNTLGAGTVSAGIVTATGNITGGNIRTAGLITAAGNIYAANFIGNISGNIDAAGNVTEIQFNTTGDQLGANANFTYNSATNAMTVNGGNIVVGNVSASGNIQGSYLLGNGSQITGLPAGYANSDVANYLSSGTVTANILTTGIISATGNIYTAGNANIDGGRIQTANATGYIFNQATLTALNLSTGANLTTVSAFTGNAVTVITMGPATTTANINLRANVTTSGNGFVNGNFFVNNGFANIGANGLNINSGGNLVISSGNLTIGGNAGVAYVKTTSATAFLYNTATTVLIGNQSSNTGNAIFSGNILGNLAISATGNITTAVNMKASYQLLTPVAFASLPTAVNGARAFVNNANLTAAGNFGQEISGGGSNNTPVWSDGVTWYIG